MFVERLGAPDVAEAIFLGERRVLPRGLRSAPMHRFALPHRVGGVPSARDLVGLRAQAVRLRACEEARARCEDERANGARLPVQTAAEVWELAENSGGHRAGTIIDRTRLKKFVEHGGKAVAESDGGEILFCRRRVEGAGRAAAGEGAVTGDLGAADAAEAVGGVLGTDGAEALRQRLTKAGALRSGVEGSDEAMEDARTMSVLFDVAGRRHRDFSDALARQTELPFPHWPFDGPRTLVEYLQTIRRRAPTPGAYHTKWLAESGLAKKSIEAHVHELGMDVLEAALSGAGRPMDADGRARGRDQLGQTGSCEPEPGDVPRQRFEVFVGRIDDDVGATRGG